MPDSQPITPPVAQQYFEDARSWEAETESMRQRSEKRAWVVASTASTIALTAVIGLVLLAPFRRNVPYLFAMEKTTGNVEFVGALDDRKVVGYQELLDKHWAQRYIVARESYNYRLLQADYDTVLGMSNDPVGRDYARLYEGADARDKKFGASVEMNVAVLSVQLSKNATGNQAVVRFAKTVRRAEAANGESPQYFVATVAYEYKPSMAGAEKDLIANPLGYRVISYRVDAELPPVDMSTTKPAGQ